MSCQGRNTWRRLAALLLAVLALSASPGAASPWTLNRGDLYGYTAFFWTRSRYFFDADGERRSFLRDGTSRVYGMQLQGAYGVTDRPMLSAQVPLLRYELEDAAVRDAGRGLGDLRVEVLWQALTSPLDAAVQGGIKLPTAPARDPSRAQVREGQYDLELLGAVGRRWPLIGLRASLDAGRRWRRRNDVTGPRPGDEWIYRLEPGYQVAPELSLAFYLSGFDGSAGDARSFGFRVPTASVPTPGGRS